MHFKQKKPALLLIDIQKGLDDEDYYGGNRNNRDAEHKITSILEKWRTMSLPIFHIQHSSLNPESRLHKSHAGFAFKEEVKPLKSEPIIVKNANSAFINTDLEEQLRNQKINILIVVGLTTNHCVSSTARMAGNLGFEVYVVSDATATFDIKGIDGQTYNSDLVHHISLANLKNEFATIIDTNTLLDTLIKK